MILKGFFLFMIYSYHSYKHTMITLNAYHEFVEYEFPFN